MCYTLKQLQKKKVGYLDGFSSFHRLLWWYSYFTFTKKLLNEEGNIPASNGNVFYAAANDITLSLDTEK